MTFIDTLTVEEFEDSYHTIAEFLELMNEEEG